MFYGLPSDLGIGYSYDYDVTYTNSAFEDRFFGDAGATWPSRRRRPVYQQDYNDQDNERPRRRQTTTSSTPRRVEQWLIDNPPSGVDTSAGHRLLHQLVRPRRLQVPRLHQDRRARPRHRLQLRRRRARAARSSPGAARPPTTRRPASGAHAPDLVLRPVRRSRVLDRQLERRRRRPGRRRRRATTACRRSGSTCAGRLPAAGAS